MRLGLAASVAIDPHHTRHCRAFTFLEVLLAVAVASLLLLAASQMIFSFSHLWQQVEEEPRFQHHVDGVMRFLEYCLKTSEYESDNIDGIIDWMRPPKQHGSGRTIAFRMDPALPFFVHDVPTHTSVKAWILFEEDEGLSLLWHIPRSQTEGRLKLHKTPVSPWVEDVEIAYLNQEKNVYEYDSYADDGREDKRSPPQAVRIRFNDRGRKAIRNLNLLEHNRHVLIY